ncbi:YHS domain-containing protein [Rhizobium sp. BK313]|uniref:YHS domain-containing (seleno)protein n=1 Tax=Rhizobium sp. BK313 TaxID=2587081 RepID=UPI00105EF533|nr:YHS domain-containing (seleno)protein [Rhizobium sp. BK313]MBB3458322.1 YHS domain-containing protein [Rhizobium sp. BK313]
MDVGTRSGVRAIGRSVAVISLAVAAAVGGSSAFADDSVNTGYFGGVAIMGYDTVAYFTEGKAVKGSEKFSYEWLGTPWHFANAEHREMFMSEPLKYAPQYGGYCAGEVTHGSVTVNIDPEAFKIVDGKLYLIYDKGHAEGFAAHAVDAVAQADGKWPRVAADLELDQYH